MCSCEDRRKGRVVDDAVGDGGVGADDDAEEGEADGEAVGEDKVERVVVVGVVGGGGGYGDCDVV